MLEIAGIIGVMVGVFAAGMQYGRRQRQPEVEDTWERAHEERVRADRAVDQILELHGAERISDAQPPPDRPPTPAAPADDRYGEMFQEETES